MTDLLATLLLQAVGHSGSFNPDKTLFYIEESLTLEEYKTAEAFLNWCVTNNRTFGHNIRQVYQEYRTA
jgi:hypothetical protein